MWLLDFQYFHLILRSFPEKLTWNLKNESFGKWISLVQAMIFSTGAPHRMIPKHQISTQHRPRRSMPSATRHPFEKEAVLLFPCVISMCLQWAFLESVGGICVEGSCLTGYSSYVFYPNRGRESFPLYGATSTSICIYIWHILYIYIDNVSINHVTVYSIHMY